MAFYIAKFFKSKGIIFRQFMKTYIPRVLCDFLTLVNLVFYKLPDMCNSVECHSSKLCLTRVFCFIFTQTLQYNGMTLNKFSVASHAQIVYKYRNLERKILKCNENMKNYVV
jgi:hypothetical protein